MSQLCTMEAVTNLFHNRPDQTKTYRVQDDIAVSLFSRLTDGMRQMTGNEEMELAAFLNVDKKELAGPFFVDPQLKCSCGRCLTFTDFTSTVFGNGVHSKKMMADILCGKNGYWLTVAGKSGKRTVKCYECDRQFEYDSHNYASPNYGYA